jgi:DNA processing protein
MRKIVHTHIPELDSMKKYPKHLSCRGYTALLQRVKLSIVGSRKPSQYTRNLTYQLAQKLAGVNVCVVSGAAMGVDAIAHLGAGADHTIAVLPSGIDVRYPAVNRELITDIEQKGLTLSQFEEGFKATAWSFVLRNEIVVALGDSLIVAEADRDSGSMRSVEYALAMGKSVYVFPHRIGESEGTNALLAQGLATPIYDIDMFVSKFGKIAKVTDDPFLAFCIKNPTLDEAVEKFGSDVYTAELEGSIRVENGLVFVC